MKRIDHFLSLHNAAPVSLSGMGLGNTDGFAGSAGTCGPSHPLTPAAVAVQQEFLPLPVSDSSHPDPSFCCPQTTLQQPGTSFFSPLACVCGCVHMCVSFLICCFHQLGTENGIIELANWVIHSCLFSQPLLVLGLARD